VDSVHKYSTSMTKVKEEERLRKAIVVHKPSGERVPAWESDSLVPAQIDHDQAGTTIHFNGYYDTNYRSRYRIETRHAWVGVKLLNVKIS